jgi:hypothetical protein
MGLDSGTGRGVRASVWGAVGLVGGSYTRNDVDAETLYAHLQHELERFTDNSLYVVMTSSKLSTIFVEVSNDGDENGVEAGRLRLPETELLDDETYTVLVGEESRHIAGRYLRFKPQERTFERVVCFLVLILQIALSASFTICAHQFFRDEAGVDITCPTGGVMISGVAYSIPTCPPPAPDIPLLDTAIPLTFTQFLCVILIEIFLFIWMSQDFILSFIGLWVS